MPTSRPQLAGPTPTAAQWTWRLGGLHEVVLHPDGRRCIVFSSGDAWVVDPDMRSGILLISGVNARWEVDGDLLLSRQGLAILRLGPAGIVWHTRRLSWDGFDDIRLVGPWLIGLAWSAVDDQWAPFMVELSTGRAEGGGYGDTDAEGWERLVDDASG